MEVNEFTAWFAGFYAADGHLEINKNYGRSINFYLAAKDIDILYKFSKELGGKVYNYSYKRIDKLGNPFQYEVVKYNCWDSKIVEYLTMMYCMMILLGL